MKITAIKSEHSNKDAIALVTEPLLTPQVFQEFEQGDRTPALQAQIVSGCLVIRSERFTPELRAELEQLLTEAEDLVSGVTAQKQAEIARSEKERQAEIEQSEKEITMESAAAGFGLPIV